MLPVILVIFFLTNEFFDRFSKNTQMSNFMKIRPVGTELFSADEWKEGQSDGQTRRS
jgi:hypothetical protein